MNTAMPHEEMTPAAFLTPNRGRKADGSVSMLLRTPAGTGLFQQVDLDYLAAAAGTDHCSDPEIGPLAREIDFCLLQLIRQLVHPDTTVELRLTPRQKRAEPPQQKCDDSP